MKVYVNAWRGPWGWRQAFYDWFKESKGQGDDVELVDDISEAELVFQGDTNNWRALCGLDRGVRCICNVLDFGEWLTPGGNPDTREYVETLRNSRGAKFTAISNKVARQLREYYGVQPEIFHYPSQVTNEIQNSTRPGVKKNFITFARLADPGKAIPEAIEAFDRSGLAAEGWKYRLVGPEPPQVPSLPNGVNYMGYMEDPASLYMMVSQSAYVVMPSHGEGLGLPIIEGMLIGRPFVARNIEPPTDIFSEIWDPRMSFDHAEDFADALCNAADDFKSENYMYKASRGFGIAMPWQREAAFESLVKLLRRHSE